jgi:hypothetical protein
MLTAMLAGSGIVAFMSAWVAADPLRIRAQKAADEMLALQESLEELGALKTEFASAEGYYQALVNGDLMRYQAAQQVVGLSAPRIKQQVRTSIAKQLGSPAATSALTAQTDDGTAAAGSTADNMADSSADSTIGIIETTGSDDMTESSNKTNERSNDEKNTNDTQRHAERSSLHLAGIHA